MINGQKATSKKVCTTSPTKKGEGGEGGVQGCIQDKMEEQTYGQGGPSLGCGGQPWKSASLQVECSPPCGH